MQWFTITWMDMDGLPLKREILHRNGPAKIWQFLLARLERKRVPEGAQGFYFRESTADETWDWDIEEPHSPSNHAIEIPISKIGPFE